MKKIRRIIFFSFALIAAFVVSMLLVKIDFNVTAAEDRGESAGGSNATGSYEAYVAEKTSYHEATYGTTTTPQGETIYVYADDYDVNSSSMEYASDGYNLAIEKLAISSNPAYEISKSKAAGKQNVVIHRYGTINFKVEVTTPGFYYLYIDYFTSTGYRSNIDRYLYINGEPPFANLSNFSFTRVWKDKQDARVKGGVEEVYNVATTKEVDGNFVISKLWRRDTNNNDLKPQQVEINSSYVVAPFKDSMGYVNEPYQFYFDQGENIISLAYTKELFVIDCLELRPVEETQSYETYLKALAANDSNLSINANGKVTINNNPTAYTRIEAEASSTKSSPTLYPITDRSSSATTPYSITKTYLNSIGGTNWKVLGDWIAWEFQVPATGYYEISMRSKQNAVRGMFSTRSVSIATVENGIYSEYETLFDELNTIQIGYKNKWRNIDFGGDSPYLFYFEEGVTYSLKMEVTLGDYAPLIARLQTAIDDLSAIYRRIIAYTTTSPDANRDYELTSKFADLFYGIDEAGNYTVAKKGEFYAILAELNDISSTIKEISGGASDKTGVIDSVSVILQKMVEKPRTIPQRLNTFSTNVSSLGSLLNELREAPLNIDYIEVHTPDVELPKATASFIKSLGVSIASFFASFFIDYSSISETGDATQSDTSIEVWMTLGRDQANTVRNLIDTSFTGDSGYAVEHYGKNINVDLKLTGGDVLLKATLAGIGPDVALNVDSSLPVNYALRNAVLDLTVFDDFFDVVYMIPDNYQTYDENYENVYMASSIRQFQFSAQEAPDEIFDSLNYSAEELKSMITGIYALPERQIFLMMFVRDDVMDELGLIDMIPETWDDVIDLVAELQAQQLQFYLPINDVGANALNPIFVSLIYQYGGSLYTSNNMESGLKSEEAMEAFQYWTELYTNYSFPTSASFINRFRTGEMPIGIAYYEMYNTLSVFAPELKGKWSFHLIPGYEKLDENGVPYVDHTATAAGTGTVIMKQEALTNGVLNETGKAAWTFVKWWTNAETQSQFGTEMEGILGSAARHSTANVKALQMLAWPAADLEVLLEQWSHVHEFPQIAGSYITGRETENAFREVINKLYNARETLYEYAQKIDKEIDRKRSEFGLPLLKDSE